MPKSKNFPGAVNGVNALAQLLEDKPASDDAKEQEAWQKRLREADLKAIAGQLNSENSAAGMKLIDTLLGKIAEFKNSADAKDAKPSFTEDELKQPFCGDLVEALRADAKDTPQLSAGARSLVAALINGTHQEDTAVVQWRKAAGQLAERQDMRAVHGTSVSGSAISISTTPPPPEPEHKLTWLSSGKGKHYKEGVFNTYLSNIPELKAAQDAFGKTVHQLLGSNQEACRQIYEQKTETERDMLRSVSPEVPSAVRAAENDVRAAQNALAAIKKEEKETGGEAKRSGVLEAAEKKLTDASARYEKVSQQESERLRTSMLDHISGPQHQLNFASIADDSQRKQAADAFDRYKRELAQTYACAIVAGHGNEFPRERKKPPALTEMHEADRKDDRRLQDMSYEATQKRKKEATDQEHKRHLEMNGLKLGSFDAWISYSNKDGTKMVVYFKEETGFFGSLSGLSERGAQNVEAAAREAFKYMKDIDLSAVQQSGSMKVWVGIALEVNGDLETSKFPKGMLGGASYPKLETIIEARNAYRDENGHPPTMGELFEFVRTQPDEKDANKKKYSADILDALVEAVGGPIKPNLEKLAQMYMDFDRMYPQAQAAQRDAARKEFMKSVIDVYDDKTWEGVKKKVIEIGQERSKAADDEESVDRQLTEEKKKDSPAVTLSTDGSGPPVPLVDVSTNPFIDKSSAPVLDAGDAKRGPAVLVDTDEDPLHVRSGMGGT